MGADTECKSKQFIVIQKAEFFYHILAGISMSCQDLTRELNIVSDVVQNRVSLRHQSPCEGWEHCSSGQESVWKKPEAVSAGEGFAVQQDRPAQGQWGSSLVADGQPGVATDSLLPPWLDGKQTAWFPPACQCSPVL